MDTLNMCRICLLENVCMESIANTNLQEIFERLTAIPFTTEDMRPSQICYICCAKLRNCYKLQSTCLRSEELFKQLLKSNQLKLSSLQAMGTLKIVHPVISMNIVAENDPDNDLVIDIKVEPLAQTTNMGLKEEIFEDTTEQHENIPNTGLYDPLKIDVFSLQDDASYYSIQTMQIGDEDMSFAGLNDEFSSKNDEVILRQVDFDNKTDAPVRKKDKITASKKNTQSTALSLRKKNKQIKRNKDDIKKAKALDIPVLQSEIVEEPSKLHLRMSDKLYRCDICKKGFNIKRYLETHIRIHTGEKPFKCDTCDASFNQKSTLNSHIRLHVGEKPYKCNICGRCFSQKNILDSHVRTHTGEKPYNCNICEKSFSHKSVLNTHIRTHTGEKPYKCYICDKYFSQRPHLKTHIRTHTGTKPYKCEICQKCFCDRSNLKQHMSRHAGIKRHRRN